MLRFLKKRKQQKGGRVVVLGIDGVPCSLLKQFIDQGLMPNLSDLAGKGTLTPMTASIPEVSSTSWSTFMTGVNPGKHGIYGFTELQQGSYQWRFPNSADIKSETLWEIAGREGRKSVVLNVPSTYPAKPLNGILTAGFVALDLRKATYPETAYEYLKSIGYRMDVDTRKAQESSTALAKEIDESFAIRKNAILHYLDSGDWDLFIGVITETDRLHHYLWVALEDENHPEHRFFLEFYRKLDEFVGEIYGRIGEDVPFIIISDHGFTTINQEVYLNAWLRERGYLSFRKENPESLSDINGQSTAFVLDPARFYIHKKGKYPEGSVDDDDYEGLRLKLKEDLLSFAVDGNQVIKAVLFREELYHGSEIDHAPDLVALSHEGFDLKGSINKSEVTGMGFLTGGHTRENAVFYINRKTDVPDVNIIDVGPTIISLLGISESSFDGRCLLS